MNALANPGDSLPTEEALAIAAPPPSRTQRRDGWLPERQARFLHAIAAGRSVQSACALVGMSVSSVYAFRRAPAGEAFANAWNAANLLAREALHDQVMERIYQGCTETVVRANGDRIMRHRIDNRLALVMLDRLDKKVEAYTAEALVTARLVAQDFDRLLGVIEQGAGARFAGTDAEPPHALETAEQAPGPIEAAPECEIPILPPLPPLHDGAMVATPRESARSHALHQSRADASPPALLNRAARRASDAKRRRKEIAPHLAVRKAATTSQAFTA